jgi:hypothetical protein
MTAQIPAIVESVITTQNADGTAHIAPMGVIWRDGVPVLAPFRPSTTLANLERQPVAVINHTDDVRVIAGCLTGRRDWPVQPLAGGRAYRLESALTHQLAEVASVAPDPDRPRFTLRIVDTISHRPFLGHNRAQAAVIEAAILVSRLDRLPAEKIAAEMAYLAIAIEKTAGTREREAWGWLVEAIAQHGQTAEDRRA